jgi:hypothetical protein
MPAYDVYVTVKLSVETEGDFSTEQVKENAEATVNDALGFTYEDRGFYHPILGDAAGTEVLEIKAVSCNRRG